MATLSGSEWCCRVDDKSFRGPHPDRTMILDALPLRATATVEDAWRWVSKRRQVLWVVALNAFLLSPLLFDLGVSRTGDEGVDKIVLFAVPASLAALLTVQLLVKRLYLCHLLLF